MRPAPKQRVAGFALIEALAAMVIASVGLLALATLQLKISQSADVARQRGEAVRLAEQKLEQLRTYTAINSAPGITAWNDLVSSTDSISSNVNYTRTWTLAGTTNDPMRRVNVALTWTDRAGNPQNVTLASVISKTDPSDSGSLSFPLPANAIALQPKNRNINIPIKASDIGNGRSSLQLRNDLAVIFSNDTGFITRTCGFVVTMASDLSGCTPTNAYMVSGYVSLSGTSSFPAGLGVSAQALSNVTGTNCYIDDSVNQNTSAAISGYKSYFCIVKVASAGTAWSGRIRLSGLASGTDYLVCRAQYPASPRITNNQRNVQDYTNVAESLDQQNYVISTATNCPSLDGLVTTIHQNCRVSNANWAVDCPAS